MLYPEDYDEEPGIPLPEAEISFRRGSAQAADWLTKTAKHMAETGASAFTIAEHLSTLAMLLARWKEGNRETPKGHPWTWAAKDVEAFIAEHCDEL